MAQASVAAEADFVMVLYNPKSRKRSSYLAEALEIVRHERGPDTPIGFVHSAFRPEQQVEICTLGSCNPDSADMLTTVVIGNSASRCVGGKILTPRGYFEKYGTQE